MGLNGLGPSTSRLSGGCSNQLSYKPVRFIVSLVLTLGGDEGVRTPDPLLAGQVLSQLSYTPVRDLLPPGFPGSLPRSLRTEYSRLYLSWVFSQVNSYPSRAFPACRDSVLLRKEVIQPHLPIRLPCYDLTPITGPTFGNCPLAVSLLTSGVSNFHGLTGGVYKARERIHRGMLIRDY